MKKPKKHTIWKKQKNMWIFRNRTAPFSCKIIAPDIGNYIRGGEIYLIALVSVKIYPIELASVRRIFARQGVRMRAT